MMADMMSVRLNCFPRSCRVSGVSGIPRSPEILLYLNAERAAARAADAWIRAGKPNESFAKDKGAVFKLRLFIFYRAKG